jgi:hypothetical protein
VRRRTRFSWRAVAHAGRFSALNPRLLRHHEHQLQATRSHLHCGFRQYAAIPVRHAEPSNIVSAESWAAASGLRNISPLRVCVPRSTPVPRPPASARGESCASVGCDWGASTGCGIITARSESLLEAA